MLYMIEGLTIRTISPILNVLKIDDKNQLIINLLYFKIINIVLITFGHLESNILHTYDLNMSFAELKTCQLEET